MLHTTASTTRCPANTPNASRGVATTQTAPSSAATTFTSAGSRCTGERPGRYSGWAWPAPTAGQSFPDRTPGLRRTRKSSPATSAVTRTPRIPASPVVPSRPPTA